ncbi:MAG: DUF4383 domain-containing protein [Solirubrobacterales bacterium]|nr:DUF4383 domain-containing protein [Solirubrobacterales bacterium]
MTTASPAQLYATLVGAALAIVGILGFFYDSGFATGSGLTHDHAFGVLAVNGWHNVLHLLTGLLGLICARRAARAYALCLGLAYVAIATWGFLATTDGAGTLLDLVPVNAEDNVLHLILGLTGLAAGAATPPAVAVPRGSTA